MDGVEGEASGRYWSALWTSGARDELWPWTLMTGCTPLKARLSEDMRSLKRSVVEGDVWERTATAVSSHDDSMARVSRVRFWRWLLLGWCSL